MTAIFFLIGCSVVLALGFLIAFFWANRSGQHEDTYTPAVRILFDDELRGEDVSHSHAPAADSAATEETITAPPYLQTDEVRSDRHPDTIRDAPPKPE